MRALSKSWHQFFFLGGGGKNVTAQHLKHIAFKSMLHACVNVTIIGGYVCWSRWQEASKPQ
jgi:hypothetical protein